MSTQCGAAAALETCLDFALYADTDAPTAFALPFLPGGMEVMDGVKVFKHFSANKNMIE
ncbi:MAG: hypothetical protein LBG43_07890 [Treponema sp.]|nr:hypothetical protein [Treponema sp.]